MILKKGLELILEIEGRTYLFPLGLGSLVIVASQNGIKMIEQAICKGLFVIKVG